MKQFHNQSDTPAQDADLAVTLVPYQQTGYFSKTVIDYLDEAASLKPFYQHSVSLEGIKNAIEARKKYPQNRQVLVEELNKQYSGLTISFKVKQNIQLLQSDNTFTITTAHQPNIFTGPLYFIYKLLHAIKLAEYLSHELSEYNFVPVYYMGSEDADLEELNHITIDGEKYEWKTQQTGAVGRMKVDKSFLELIDKIEGQIGVEPYGKELTSLFRKCYRKDVTIQQATLELVNELFGEFGLFVLNPDNANLKRIFNPVVKKELTEKFSHKAVAETLHQLQQQYKVQAAGREINLFYLLDDKRERIEIQNSKFKIQNSEAEFTLNEMLDEVETHPERFSGNVILRGVFQETILPNIIFIGGGGELNYWLELKGVFEAANVPYPVLVLRNSFLLINQHQIEKLHKLRLNVQDVFQSKQELLNQFVNLESDKQLTLEKEIDQAKAFYHHLKNVSGEIDTTLQQHVEALQTKAIKKLIELEKKMLRSERKKFDAQERQINKLKDHLFPQNNLQERVENISFFYARYNQVFLHYLFQASLDLQQQFIIFKV